MPVAGLFYRHVAMESVPDPLYIQEFYLCGDN